MKELSSKAKSLWAKKSGKGESFWLSLVLHMTDSAGVAQKLWNRWLAEGVKQIISGGVYDNRDTERLLIFLAAAHDIGKAIPLFQAKKSADRELDQWAVECILKTGLPMEHISYFPHASKTPHALATQMILEYAGFDRRIAVILGSHHGKPPDQDVLVNAGINTYAENFHLGAMGKDAWNSVQQELIGYALRLAGFASIKEVPVPNIPAQVLLSGLVIMADWIASNEKYFPYANIDDLMLPIKDSRVEFAWKCLTLPYPWEADNTWMNSDLYKERFGPDFLSNPVQFAVQQIATSIRKPGILVLEAPMGSGKTEAALVLAEIFAAKTKRKGIFFALPTQATSDGIFPRILKWVSKLESDGMHSLRLMHGKAEFNEEYKNLPKGINIVEDEDSSIFVHEWFAGRKKAILDEFVTGTIDQILLAALKQKHVMLRHLGLSNKVIIIDECHAYDAYMGQYLMRVLSWLGAYNVPVIVLSATLPMKKRLEIVDAYQNNISALKAQDDPLGKGDGSTVHLSGIGENRDYPLITYTDGGNVRQKAIIMDNVLHKVRLEFISDDMIVDRLGELLSDGGCAGIIVNTVKRAQVLAKILSEHFGKETVRLLHSRFLSPDRGKKEKELLKELGKPGEGVMRPVRCIVVGTQVLEQSLDIDFDILISDICPIDLLLQRIGRLHRHIRSRPEKLRLPLCLITGVDGDVFEKDTENIYGKYLLLRTKARLPKFIILPGDISSLVQDVYGDESQFLSISPDYLKAKADHEKYIAKKEKRAKDFRIGQPWPEGNISSWLETDVSDKSGEAAVRDSDESIEVLLIQKRKDGELCLLPWIEKGRIIAKNETPDEELSMAIARCSVRLPAILCAPWMIDETIKQLEDFCREQLCQWQKSYWLSGQLFLVLDEKYSVNLCGYHIVYDKNIGLLYEKEGQ